MPEALIPDLPAPEAVRADDVVLAVTDEDVELARTALLDITPAETVGDSLGHLDEGDGVVSVYFDVLLPGYPGWRWTTTIAHVDGASSVLETEMTPGDGALLSPDWVPWVDRLADYRAAQEASDLAAEQALISEAGETADDFDDDDDDDDDFEESDDDDDETIGGSLLHSGDLDGVDIDALDDDDDDPADGSEAPAPADGIEEPEGPENDADDAGDEPSGVEAPADEQ